MIIDQKIVIIMIIMINQVIYQKEQKIIKKHNISKEECDKENKNQIIYKPMNDDTLYNHYNKSKKKMMPYLIPLLYIIQK